MAKKAMAYKHKGMKVKEQDLSECKPKDFPSKAKMAPKTEPSMNKKHPSGLYKYPKEGQQSMTPMHKKSALPKEHAVEGVADVNGGKGMSLPKGGGVGESEV